MAVCGLFAQWQPKYAERGIPTFPVRDKRPAVSNYLRMGLPASHEMAVRFGQADAFGFACGKRSRITVVDVDSPNERMLIDALDRFGSTPIIVRSGSGNHQAWYRHNGEGRRIRPDKSNPIDILGGGYVVAPPSQSPRGAYGLISGSLDDLATLPTIRPQDATPTALVPPRHGDRIERGRRNEALWRECMRQAHDCPSVERLLEAAVQANQTMFHEPLLHDEVQRIVASAWGIETSGCNAFGLGARVIIPADQIDELLKNYPDAFILLTILRRHHWGREFVCANAMAEIMPGGGWTVKRLSAARRKLEELGEIEMVRPASRPRGAKLGGPAVYRFKGSQR